MVAKKDSGWPKLSATIVTALTLTSCPVSGLAQVGCTFATIAANEPLQAAGTSFQLWSTGIQSATFANPRTLRQFAGRIPTLTAPDAGTICAKIAAEVLRLRTGIMFLIACDAGGIG